MSDTIKCGNCGTDSGIERAENDGATAFKLHRAGWKVKLPVLAGISDWLFCCSDDCLKTLRAKVYVENGVTGDDVQRANKVVEDFKAKIPGMAKEVGGAMAKLQKILKRERKI